LEGDKYEEKGFEKHELVEIIEEILKLSN